MAAIFSTRMDEALIQRLDRAARRHGMTKKKLVEKALRAYLDELGPQDQDDVLSECFGAWKRKESPAATTRRVRKKMVESTKRRRR